MDDLHAAAPAEGNWGRWGEDDERGAANLLTPEAILAAVGTVREGRLLSLAMPIRGSTSGPARASVPHLPGRPLPQHFMSIDGADYRAGARLMNGVIGVADDALMISHHGTTTHMDALCHMWRGEALYNGHSAARVRSYGATRCGIEKAGPLVARGVLFDVAAHLEMPYLDETVRIDADLLGDIAKTNGIELRPGDVAVVRTGWPTVYETDRARYQGGQPGLSHDGGRWLADHDVTAVACDNAAVGALALDGSFDAGPDEDLHLLLLWSRGIYLLEMLWLEELARTGRHDFLFVAAPLAIEGGTGSPVNPVAVL
ncbi:MULTISPECIES: cyclase family protein [unclassified Streptomyces]|uniref:cyclase family protein n=1 Tax=unclassified Streptomyces TaxID=2593676 RepID=UPI003250DAED